MAALSAEQKSTTVSNMRKHGHLLIQNSCVVSTLNCLLSSTDFRSITPLWYVKEKKCDDFQVEGIIVGWELHLRSKDRDQFVLSDEYTSDASSGPKLNFMDYSLGDRITTIARTFSKIRSKGYSIADLKK